MQKILTAIARVRGFISRSRKAVIPAVTALGLIVGTDASLYVDVTAILVALGVYAIPNAD